MEMRGKVEFSSDEIHNILYSGIRNKHHFRIRAKGFIVTIMKNIFALFKSGNFYLVDKNQTILNDAPRKDQIKGGDNFDVIIFDKNSPGIKPLLAIETLLLLGFLFKIGTIQRYLFRVATKVAYTITEKRNIKGLICGHPTVLLCFLGLYLKKKSPDNKIITVQHGIYNLNEYQVLWFEKEVATHVILFGQYFKDLYKHQGVKENKLIIGAPYFSGKLTEGDREIISLDVRREKALFLGQQLYKVYPGISQAYNKIITQLLDELREWGVELHYKPHPREDIEYSLNDYNRRHIKIFRGNKNFHEDLDDFDFFYSINSTLLLEVYLKKKVCFQIDVGKDIKLDKFCRYTGIPIVNSAQIKNHLNEREYQFYYDHRYMNIQHHPDYFLQNLIISLFSDEKNKANRRAGVNSK